MILQEKNIADENSMRAAVYLAVDIVRNRLQYSEITANPLQKNRTCGRS